MENNEELTIDINQYIQFDEDGEMKIYIQIDKFLNDALEYLKNDNPEYEIVKEWAWKILYQMISTFSKIREHG